MSADDPLKNFDELVREASYLATPKERRQWYFYHHRGEKPPAYDPLQYSDNLSKLLQPHLKKGFLSQSDLNRAFVEISTSVFALQTMMPKEKREEFGSVLLLLSERGADLLGSKKSVENDIIFETVRLLYSLHPRKYKPLIDKLMSDPRAEPHFGKLLKEANLTKKGFLHLIRSKRGPLDIDNLKATAVNQTKRKHPVTK